MSYFIIYMIIGWIIVLANLDNIIIIAKIKELSFSVAAVSAVIMSIVWLPGIIYFLVKNER